METARREPREPAYGLLECLNAEALPHITRGRREVSPDEEFVDQHESKVTCLLHDFSDARRRGMVCGERTGDPVSTDR